MIKPCTALAPQPSAASKSGRGGSSWASVLHAASSIFFAVPFGSRYALTRSIWASRNAQRSISKRSAPVKPSAASQSASRDSSCAAACRSQRNARSLITRLATAEASLNIQLALLVLHALLWHVITTRAAQRIAPWCQAQPWIERFSASAGSTLRRGYGIQFQDEDDMFALV